VSHTKMENIYIKASSSGLTPACTNLVAINHAAPNSLVYLTQPMANQVEGNSFEIQPKVQISDIYGNLTSSSSYSVTFEPFIDATCTTSASITLNNNSGNSTAGIYESTSLSASNAQTNLYLKAKVGTIEACSIATTVYPPLQITYSDSVNTLDSQTMVINGGVPPINCGALIQNESSPTIGSCYTSGCSGDLCINYVAGPIGGSSNDSFAVTDNGFTISSEIVTTTVMGPVLELQSGNANFGQSSLDITENFIFTNTSLQANNLSVTISGPDAAYFEIGSLDECSGSNLDTNVSCQLYIDFLASGAPAATVLNATLEVTGLNGGKVTINLTGETP
jgi:hypothetical protein